MGPDDNQIPKPPLPPLAPQKPQADAPLDIPPAPPSDLGSFQNQVVQKVDEVFHPEENEMVQKRKMPIQHGLETYAGDMADAVRMGETSIIKIAMAEKKRQEENQEATSPTSSRNRNFIVISIVCLLIGGAAIYLGLHRVPARVQVQTPAPQTQSIIYADSVTEINTDGVNRDTLVGDINAAMTNAQLKPGEVLNIFVTKGQDQTKVTLSSSEFFALLKTNIPPPLTLALKDNFMLGVYGGDTNSLFMIFKTDVPDDAYASMLSWERKLFYDLFPIFKIDVSGDRAQLVDQNFTDTLIQNKDARAIKDNAGNIAFFYSFVDQSTLLIAENPKVLSEVLARIYSKSTNPTN